MIGQALPLGVGTHAPLSGARVKLLRRNRSSTKSHAANACACEGKSIKASSMNQRHLRPRERIARANTFTSLVHTNRLLARCSQKAQAGPHTNA